MDNEEIMPMGEDAVIAVQALGFLFDWLGSKDFKSPCDFFELSQLAELRRFFERDYETRQLRNDVFDWLQKNNYLRIEAKRRPGRRRSTEYGWAEHRRAERGLCGFLGWLNPETEKRYRTVLGEHKTRGVRYVVVQDNLFALFELQYGLPNGCTPTEFARSHGIPPKFAKAWVRNLVDRELVRLVFVRGKQVVKVLCWN